MRIGRPCGLHATTHSRVRQPSIMPDSADLCLNGAAAAAAASWLSDLAVSLHLFDTLDRRAEM